MDGFGNKPLSRGESVIWLTPRKILDVLGKFDLDPCAAPSPRPWETAYRSIELPQDGLSYPWSGRVWLNPPYDTPTMTKFMRKMASHRRGIALLFARTDTLVWQNDIFPFCDSILFLKGRISFHKPDGTKAWGSGAPSALISYSPFDTVILQASGLEGHIR